MPLSSSSAASTDTISLKDGRICFGNDHISVELMRTLRVNNISKAVLPKLGSFQIASVEDHLENAPQFMKDRLGFIIPMYQCEAMWMQFKTSETHLLRAAVNGFDALTGQPWSPEFSEKNYILLDSNKQEYLSSVKIDDDVLQLVARQGHKGKDNSSECNSIQIMMYGPKLIELVVKLPETKEKSILKVPKSSCMVSVRQQLLWLRPELLDVKGKRAVLYCNGIIQERENASDFIGKEIDIILVDICPVCQILVYVRVPGGQILDFHVHTQKQSIRQIIDDICDILMLKDKDNHSLYLEGLWLQTNRNLLHYNIKHGCTLYLVNNKNHPDGGTIAYPREVISNQAVSTKELDQEFDASAPLSVWVTMVTPSEWLRITGAPAFHTPISKQTYIDNSIRWVAVDEKDSLCTPSTGSFPSHFALGDAEIPFDIFNFIMSFVPAYPYFFRLKQVCTSWNRVLGEKLIESTTKLDLVPRWRSLADDPLASSYSDKCPVRELQSTDYNKLYTLFPRLEEVELFKFAHQDNSAQSTWLPNLWWFGPTLKRVTLFISLNLYPNGNIQASSQFNLLRLVVWLNSLPSNVVRLEIVNVHGRSCTLQQDHEVLLKWLNQRRKEVPEFTLHLRYLTITTQSKAATQEGIVEHYQRNNDLELVNYFVKKQGMHPNQLEALFNRFDKGKLVLSIAPKHLDTLFSMGYSFSYQTLHSMDVLSHAKNISALVDNCPNGSTTKHLASLRDSFDDVLSALTAEQQSTIVRCAFDRPDFEPSNNTISCTIKRAVGNQNLDIIEYITSKFPERRKMFHSYAPGLFHTLMRHAINSDTREQFKQQFQFILKLYEGDLGSFLQQSKCSIHDLIAKDPSSELLTIMREMIKIDPEALVRQDHLLDTAIHTWVAKFANCALSCIPGTNEELLSVGKLFMEVLGEQAFRRLKNRFGHTPIMTFLSTKANNTLSTTVIQQVIEFLLPPESGEEDWFGTTNNGLGLLKLSLFGGENLSRQFLEYVSRVLPKPTQQKLFFGQDKDGSKPSVIVELFLEHCSLVQPLFELIPYDENKAGQLIYVPPSVRCNDIFPSQVPLLHGIVLSLQKRGRDVKQLLDMFAFVLGREDIDCSVQEEHTKATILHCAVLSGLSTQIIRLLLDKGTPSSNSFAFQQRKGNDVPVVAKTAQGETALVMATRLKQRETVILLLKYEQDSLIDVAEDLKTKSDPVFVDKMVYLALEAKRQRQEATTATAPFSQASSSSFSFHAATPYLLSFSLMESASEAKGETQANAEAMAQRRIVRRPRKQHLNITIQISTTKAAYYDGIAT